MTTLRVVALCTLLASFAILVRAEQNQVWAGTLVDASCYLTDNSQVGSDHMGMKSCASACLKMGRPAGLLTSDKKFFVLLVPSPDIAQYAGRAIRVTGKLRNGSILVDRLEVKKGSEWVAAKFNTMM